MNIYRKPLSSGPKNGMVYALDKQTAILERRYRGKAPEREEPSQIFQWASVIGISHITHPEQSAFAVRLK